MEGMYVSGYSKVITNSYVYEKHKEAGSCKHDATIEIFRNTTQANIVLDGALRKMTIYGKANTINISTEHHIKKILFHETPLALNIMIGPGSLMPGYIGIYQANPNMTVFISSRIDSINRICAFLNMYSFMNIKLELSRSFMENKALDIKGIIQKCIPYPNINVHINNVLDLVIESGHIISLKFHISEHNIDDLLESILVFDDIDHLTLYGDRFTGSQQSINKLIFKVNTSLVVLTQMVNCKLILDDSLQSLHIHKKMKIPRMLPYNLATIILYLSHKTDLSGTNIKHMVIYIDCDVAINATKLPQFLETITLIYNPHKTPYNHIQRCTACHIRNIYNITYVEEYGNF